MERLDKELVKRGLAESRTKAQELIGKGLVLVNGVVVTKLSYNVADNDAITIQDNELFKYVSRGGFKLEKAIKVFGYDMIGKSVMDIGSSTGGFTDCALQHGAKSVLAIDVGTDVMHPSLRNDSRVELHENTNIKDVPLSYFDGIDVVVVDVSFISLTKIIEKVAESKKTLDMLCLIKPQFECGREIASKYNGLILNKDIHYKILQSMIDMFNQYGYSVLGLDYSPIKGGDGNIEYIVHISNINPTNKTIDIKQLINIAFEQK